MRPPGRFMEFRFMSVFFAAIISLLFIISPCFADIAIDHFQKGNKYSKEGKFQLAIKEYREAIKTNPQMADFHYNLANVLLSTDKFQEAIKEYKKAISMNPLDSDYTRNLGIAYIFVGEIDKAKEIHQNLKNLNPANAKQLQSFLSGVNKK